MRYALAELIILILLGSAVTLAQPRIIDPFFGIEYDPAEVHFDRIPALIKERCPDLRDYYAKAWVYGRLKSKDTEFFIVYGLIKVRSNGHPGTFSIQLEEDDGHVVALRGSECLVNQWQFLLRKEADPTRGIVPIKISDNELVAISDDLLQRYTRAFGGKKNFLRRVDPGFRKDLPPLLQRQFDIYEKQQLGGQQGNRRLQ